MTEYEVPILIFSISKNLTFHVHHFSRKIVVQNFHYFNSLFKTSLSLMKRLNIKYLRLDPYLVYLPMVES